MEERDEKTTSTVNGNKFWDKVKESRLFAGLVTGLAGIAGAGIVYLATILVGAKEERSRTFDLLSNREIAANELNAKVFEIYVQYVVPALEDSVNDHKKVALLAGLHSNFSEIFDTRPVFEAFAENIKNPTARHELTRLAKRVARRQAEFIKAHVDPTNEDTRSEKITLHPGDPPHELDSLGHSGSLQIIGEPRRHYTIVHAKKLKKEKPALGDDGDELIDDVSDFVIIKVTFNGKEPFTFELSYMDTPYMDNIWMLHSNAHHQIALRLVDIDTNNEEHEVKIEILHFPGDVYAATQRLPVKELLRGGHKHEQ